jgi:hypothetical protein
MAMGMGMSLASEPVSVSESAEVSSSPVPPGASAFTGDWVGTLALFRAAEAGSSLISACGTGFVEAAAESAFGVD